jgi:6-pyruvoyltetrahydropterin/6-carboxytetrahydropterin synthase
MIYLTRREQFNAAHRMFRSDWSDEKNLEVYGKCSNPNWHGHNYVLYVTVKGKINPETGYVVNLKELSQIIKDEVIEQLDHKNLNTEVPFLKGKIMSSENVASGIWQQLEKPVKQLGAQLHCIRLQETENNYIEYYGD